jgi:hypothetical protein
VATTLTYLRAAMPREVPDEIAMPDHERAGGTKFVIIPLKGS